MVTQITDKELDAQGLDLAIELSEKLADDEAVYRVLTAAIRQMASLDKTQPEPDN